MVISYDYEMSNKFYLSDGGYINLETKRPSATPKQLEELKSKHPAIYEMYCEKVRAYNNARHGTLDPELKRRQYEKQQEWRTSDAGRAQLAAYAKRYREKNAQARKVSTVRGAIWAAMHNGTNVATAEEYLGCSIPEYRRYLESKFLDGMSWDNFGRGTGKWCIDHVRPIAFFDITNQEELKQCFRWTNTQCLWNQDNLAKWHIDKHAGPAPSPSLPSSSVSVP